MRAGLIAGACALAAALPALAAPDYSYFRKECPGISADPNERRPALSLPDIEKLAASVRAEHYPELDGLDIRVKGFHGGADYLRASLDFDSGFKPARRRAYLLLVNTDMLASPPSDAALRGILTHELSHIRDYSRMSSLRLADFAAGYALGPIRSYERATDETALLKGEGCGLIEYRLWLYAHESGSALAEKMRDYDTPDEMLRWMIARDRGLGGS